MKSLFLVPWSRFVFLEPPPPSPPPPSALPPPASSSPRPAGASSPGPAAQQSQRCRLCCRTSHSLQRRPPAAGKPRASAASGARAGHGSPCKQKDVIVTCKALCKIHIYRIIKSVQTQVAGAFLRQRDWGRHCGAKEKAGCWAGWPSDSGHPPGARITRWGQGPAEACCPAGALTSPSPSDVS